MPLAMRIVLALTAITGLVRHVQGQVKGANQLAMKCWVSPTNRPHRESGVRENEDIAKLTPFKDGFCCCGKEEKQQQKETIQQQVAFDTPDKSLYLIAVQGLKEGEAGFAGKPECEPVLKGKSKKKWKPQGGGQGTDPCPAENQQAKEIVDWCKNQKACMEEVKCQTEGKRTTPSGVIEFGRLRGCSCEPECALDYSCCIQCERDCNNVFTNQARRGQFMYLLKKVRHCEKLKDGTCKSTGKQCSCTPSCVIDDTCCVDDPDTPTKDESYLAQCSTFYRQTFLPIASRKKTTKSKATTKNKATTTAKKATTPANIDSYVSYKDLQHILKANGCQGTCCEWVQQNPRSAEAKANAIAQKFVELAEAFFKEVYEKRSKKCNANTRMSADQCCDVDSKTIKYGRQVEFPPSRACCTKKTCENYAPPRNDRAEDKTKKIFHVDNNNAKIGPILMEAMCSVTHMDTAVAFLDQFSEQAFDLLWAVCEVVKERATRAGAAPAAGARTTETEQQTLEREREWCRNSHKIPTCAKSRLNFKGAAGMCYKERVGTNGQRTNNDIKQNLEDPGRVYRVQNGGQALKKGVMVGWQIRCVNDEPWTDAFDDGAWQKKIQSGNTYALVFYKPANNANRPDTTDRGPCDNEVWTALRAKASSKGKELKVDFRQGIAAGQKLTIHENNYVIESVSGYPAEGQHESNELTIRLASEIERDHASGSEAKIAMVQIDGITWQTLHDFDVQAAAKKQKIVRRNLQEWCKAYIDLKAGSQIGNVAPLKEYLETEDEACAACQQDSGCVGYFEVKHITGKEGDASRPDEPSSTSPTQTSSKAPSNRRNSAPAGQASGNSGGGTPTAGSPTGSTPTAKKPLWGILNSRGSEYIAMGLKVRSDWMPTKYMEVVKVMTKEDTKCGAGQTFLAETCLDGMWALSDSTCKQKCKELGVGFSCSKGTSKLLVTNDLIEEAVSSINLGCQKDTPSPPSDIGMLSEDGQKCYIGAARPRSPDVCTATSNAKSNRLLCFCKADFEDDESKAFDPFTEKAIPERREMLQRIKDNAENNKYCCGNNNARCKSSIVPLKPIFCDHANANAQDKCSLPESPTVFRKDMEKIEPYGCERTVMDKIMQHYELLKKGMVIQKEIDCQDPSCNPHWSEFAKEMFKARFFEGADALWSSGDALSEHAFLHGHTPLEWTRIGRCMNHNKYFEFDGVPVPSKAWLKCSANLWNILSAKFTEAFKGPVYIYLTLCQFWKVLFMQEVPNMGTHLQHYMKKTNKKSVKVYLIGMKVRNEPRQYYTKFFDGLTLSIEQKHGLTHRTCKVEDATLMHLVWAANRFLDCMVTGIHQLELPQGKCVGDRPDYADSIATRCRDFYECPYEEQKDGGSCVILQQREDPANIWLKARRLKGEWAGRFKNSSVYPSIGECREHVPSLSLNQAKNKKTYRYKTKLKPGSEWKCSNEAESTPSTSSSTSASSTSTGSTSSAGGPVEEPIATEEECFAASTQFGAKFNFRKGTDCTTAFPCRKYNEEGKDDVKAGCFRGSDDKFQWKMVKDSKDRLVCGMPTTELEERLDSEKDGEWKTVFASGSLGDWATDREYFNNRFKKAELGIVRWSCSGCAQPHQKVYIRMKVPEKFDAWNVFMMEWKKENGWKKEWNIFSSYDNAVTNNDPWAICETTKIRGDSGKGFPLNCKPTQSADKRTQAGTNSGTSTTANFKWSTKVEQKVILDKSCENNGEMWKEHVRIIGKKLAYPPQSSQTLENVFNKMIKNPEKPWKEYAAGIWPKAVIFRPVVAAQSVFFERARQSSALANKIPVAGKGFMADGKSSKLAFLTKSFMFGDKSSVIPSPGFIPVDPFLSKKPKPSNMVSIEAGREVVKGVPLARAKYKEDVDNDMEATHRKTVRGVDAQRVTKQVPRSLPSEMKLPVCKDLRLKKETDNQKTTKTWEFQDPSSLVSISSLRYWVHDVQQDRGARDDIFSSKFADLELEPTMTEAKDHLRDLFFTDGSESYWYHSEATWQKKKTGCLLLVPKEDAQLEKGKRPPEGDKELFVWAYIDPDQEIGFRYMVADYDILTFGWTNDQMPSVKKVYKQSMIEASKAPGNTASKKNIALKEADFRSEKDLVEAVFRATLGEGLRLQTNNHRTNDYSFCQHGQVARGILFEKECTLYSWSPLPILLAAKYLVREFATNSNGHFMIRHTDEASNYFAGFRNTVDGEEYLMVRVVNDGRIPQIHCKSLQQTNLQHGGLGQSDLKFLPNPFWTSSAFQFKFNEDEIRRVLTHGDMNIPDIVQWWRTQNGYKERPSEVAVLGVKGWKETKGCQNWASKQLAAFLDSVGTRPSWCPPPDPATQEVILDSSCKTNGEMWTEHVQIIGKKLAYPPSDSRTLTGVYNSMLPTRDVTWENYAHQIWPKAVIFRPVVRAQASFFEEAHSSPGISRTFPVAGKGFMADGKSSKLSFLSKLFIYNGLVVSSPGFIPVDPWLSKKPPKQDTFDVSKLVEQGVKGVDLTWAKKPEDTQNYMQSGELREASSVNKMRITEQKAKKLPSNLQLPICRESQLTKQTASGQKEWVFPASVDLVGINSLYYWVHDFKNDMGERDAIFSQQFARFELEPTMTEKKDHLRDLFFEDIEVMTGSAKQTYWYHSQAMRDDKKQTGCLLPLLKEQLEKALPSATGPKQQRELFVWAYEDQAQAQAGGIRYMVADYDILTFGWTEEQMPEVKKVYKQSMIHTSAQASQTSNAVLQEADFRSEKDLVEGVFRATLGEGFRLEKNQPVNDKDYSYCQDIGRGILYEKECTYFSWSPLPILPAAKYLVNEFATNANGHFMIRHTDEASNYFAGFRNKMEEGDKHLLVRVEEDGSIPWVHCNILKPQHLTQGFKQPDMIFLPNPFWTSTAFKTVVNEDLINRKLTGTKSATAIVEEWKKQSDKQESLGVEGWKEGGAPLNWASKQLGFFLRTD